VAPFLRSIRAQLFIFYTGLIMVIIAVLGFSFFIYTSSLLTQRATETMVQLSGAIARQLDAAVKVVDETSIRVAYSNLVMDTFLRYQATPRVDTVNRQRALRDIFIAIMGPLQSVWQINLYDLHGTVVGAGADNTVSTVDLVAQPWYGEAIRREGARLITSPYERDTRQPERRFVSLVRLYYDRGNVPIGFIEVAQVYGRIFEGAASTVRTMAPWINDSRLFVVDAAGDAVFPFDARATGEIAPYVAAIRAAAPGATAVVAGRGAGRQIVAHADSAYTGWSVVLAASEASLLGPLFRFSRVMVAAGLAFLLLSALVSFLMAGRLTRPIQRIHGMVAGLTIRGIPGASAAALDSGFNELESLSQSFQDMRGRLDRSIAALIRSKEHEANARMLALQSQMNPHFLSNTVTTVSILAEEGRTAEVIGACDDLLFMLRYVASGGPPRVTLAEELEYTTRYLSLMRHRYGEKVAWEIGIPDALLGVAVPKLVVQPLVENSLKYGIHVEPPWRIGIRGTAEAPGWRVAVTDAGTGFTEQALEELSRGMAGVRRGEEAPREPLAGMGLLNIYARLLLLYGEEAVFQAGNPPGGGARVVIGGGRSPLQRHEPGALA
jgi:two-component system, sensor histidine kinase YesM